MLNDYILSSFYLHQLSQITWPLWIHCFNSIYTIISVSLPKYFSSPFETKAFPHNSHWVLSSAHCDSAAEVTKPHINMWSSSHEWHQIQNSGNDTRKSRRERIFVKVNKTWEKSESICTHLRSQVHSKRFNMHSHAFQVQVCISSKKPRPLEALGCTDLQLPQGGSGVTQNKEATILKIFRHFWKLIQCSGCCLCKFVIYIYIYYRHMS